MQLIIIESLFMLFVILSKISIMNNYQKLHLLLGYGFRSLFVLQFLFFMLYQYTVKSYLGLIRTAMFLLLLIPWFSTVGLQGDIDSIGRFYFSGTLAPDYIILYYCFWVIGVPLVDSKTLPNLITASLHFSSVIVALVSLEFFHARLLTASHLFILDYLLSYSSPSGKVFGVLNPKQFEQYNNHIKPCIDGLTLCLCGLVFIKSYGYYLQSILY